MHNISFIFLWTFWDIFPNHSEIGFSDHSSWDRITLSLSILTTLLACNVSHCGTRVTILQVWDKNPKPTKIPSFLILYASTKKIENHFACPQINSWDFFPINKNVNELVLPSYCTVIKEKFHLNIPYFFKRLMGNGMVTKEQSGNFQVLIHIAV